MQHHVPTGIKLDAFLALPADPDIDGQITAQTQAVNAVRQAGAIRDRAALSEFSAPAFPKGFAELLSRTIDDIAEDAERQLNEHLVAHSLTGGGNWIAQGIAHAGDACPFCGQDIRACR